MKNFLRVVASLAVMVSAAWAVQPDRIAGAIDSSQTVVVKGSVSPRAQAQFDQGPVDAGMKLASIRLMFAPSPAQQAALEKLLAEQKDSASPNYQKWLTPQQYADRFALSRNDTKKIAGWLQAQGFTIVQIANSRTWITFSGTAAQVNSVFKTEIHRYNVDGEVHFSNSADVSIPKALAGAVSGFRGLNDFYPRPLALPKKIVPLGEMQSNPDYTSGGSTAYLAPDDIATIYDISALYTAGYEGSGQAIAIVSQSLYHTTDLTNFLTFFKLTAPTIHQVTDTNTGCPGYTGAEAEADLDVETVSGVARNATIYFICGSSADDDAAFVIDNHTTIPVAVISESYGICESGAGNSYLSQQETIAQQGNSEGITWAASSGDTGAAGCEPNGGSSKATTGLAVNEPAVLPDVTGVGGSEFSGDVGDFSQYWNASNSPTGESAKSYIPEMAWNDSDITGNGPILSSTLAASGGGASIFFPKPSWQVGTGVPSSPNARFVPDVAITASANHDGYIIFCSNASDGCTANTPLVFGGTSAAAPVFSSILILLNDYLHANGAPSLTNVNQTLYSIAQSNSGPTIFHDITTGSNIVPCVNPSPNCPTSAPFQFGFKAGVGYDEVTGLGSVNAYNFVTGWNSAGSGIPTTTTLTSASTANVGTTSVTLSATVKATSGTATGTVTFSANGTQVGNPVALSAGKASATYSTGSLPVGTYAITAIYNPTGNFGGSNGSGSLAIQDFAIAANPTTVNVSAPGQGGTSTITLTPGSSGFGQVIAFTCAGLPAKTTCSASSVTPGSKVTTTMLTITTTATTGQLHETPWGRGKALFYAMLFPGFLGLISVRGKRTLRGIRWLALLGALALCSVWLACGGGSSSSVPGTPAGNSTVTVTASAGTLAHPVTITLAVQ
jgi:subtilase family serine protease